MKLYKRPKKSSKSLAASGIAPNQIKNGQTSQLVDKRPESMVLSQLSKLVNRGKPLQKKAETVQRQLKIGTTDYDLQNIIILLKSDENAVWHNGYIPILKDLIKKKVSFETLPDLLLRMGGILVANRPKPYQNLYNVTASSAHHDLKLISRKAASAAGKAYGFSFVDKGAEAADIKLINAHIKHCNEQKDSTLLNWGGVVHGPATHRSAREGMIQYLVRGRIYSTHADTTQLFPVKGAGIICGLGAAEMMVELSKLNKLTLKIFYRLQGGQKAWAQVSRKVKAQTETDFKKWQK